MFSLRAACTSMLRFSARPLSGMLTKTPVKIAAMSYSTAKEPAYLQLQNRKTRKDVLSRETFLVDYYKYLNDNNEILLFVHHNNLTKADNRKVRSEFTKIGAQLNVIRNHLYNVYLRSENSPDPADAATSRKNKSVKHPLSPLLVGPTAIITIPKCEPSLVKDVLKVIKQSQDKLIVMGAKIDSDVFDLTDIDKFKELPNREQLQGQLAGLLSVLGGAGLVRTLEASSNMLYLTLDEHRKNNDPSEE